jgi:hypothetical protein
MQVHCYSMIVERLPRLLQPQSASAAFFAVESICKICKNSETNLKCITLLPDKTTRLQRLSVEGGIKTVFIS